MLGWVEGGKGRERGVNTLVMASMPINSGLFANWTRDVAWNRPGREVVVRLSTFSYHCAVLIFARVRRGM